MMNHDAQDRPAVAFCESRQCEIWHDEPVFLWEGKWICLDCFKDRIGALLEDNPVQLANEMNIEVMRYV